MLAVLLLVLTACARASTPNDAFQVALVLDPNPPVVGPATVTVSLRDASGAPIPGAVMELEGTMTHPGMAPVLAAAREVAPGQYRAELSWTMAGDWVVIVRARLPDGQSLERTLPVPGVR